MKQCFILLCLFLCNYFCSSSNKRRKIVPVKKNVPVVSASNNVVIKNNSAAVAKDQHNDINKQANQTVVINDLLKDIAIAPVNSETKKNNDVSVNNENKSSDNNKKDNDKKPSTPEENEKEDKRIAGMVDEYIKQNSPAKGISTQDILKGVGLLLSAVFGTVAAYGIGKLLKSVSSKEVDKAFKEIGKTANQFGDFLSGKKGELKLSDGRVIKGQELIERLDEFNGLMKKLGSPQGLIKRSMDLFENFVASPKSTVRDFLTRTKELKDVDYSKLIGDLLGIKKDYVDEKKDHDEHHNKEPEVKLI